LQESVSVVAIGRAPIEASLPPIDLNRTFDRARNLMLRVALERLQDRAFLVYLATKAWLI